MKAREKEEEVSIINVPLIYVDITLAYVHETKNENLLEKSLNILEDLYIENDMSYQS